MVVLAYLLLLPIFYIFHTGKSKALIIFEYIWKKGKYVSYSATSEEKTALLAWLVKCFWAPLMIFWLTGHIISMINQ
jgi:hypothetical protein